MLYFMESKCGSLTLLQDSRCSWRGCGVHSGLYFYVKPFFSELSLCQPGCFFFRESLLFAVYVPVTAATLVLLPYSLDWTGFRNSWVLLGTRWWLPLWNKSLDKVGMDKGRAPGGKLSCLAFFLPGPGKAGSFFLLKTAFEGYVFSEGN